MTFTFQEVLWIVGAIFTAITGGGGYVAWRNSTIDNRKSVTEQLNTLNQRLNDEIRRMDTELDEARKALVDYQVKAAEREQELQRQITDVQRAASDRERTLQEEIRELHLRISRYVKEIEDLRQQLKQSGGH